MLEGITYMIRHNPNCPKAFEVRTCGDAATVDVREPLNLITHGDTMEEAMSLMVDRLAVRAKARIVETVRCIYGRS